MILAALLNSIVPVSFDKWAEFLPAPDGHRHSLSPSHRSEKPATGVVARARRSVRGRRGDHPWDARQHVRAWTRAGNVGLRGALRPDLLLKGKRREADRCPPTVKKTCDHASRISGPPAGTSATTQQGVRPGEAMRGR